MQAAEMRAPGGATARLFRISFSGELAYEIAVPARYAESCIARIVEAGATPYGTDALSALRIEKGHPAGPELNGQTTARDLGLARICSTTKDYIGRVMADRPALLAPDRPALVGLRASQHLPAGAHLLPTAAPTAINDQGWVSSSCFSPTLERWIGLGFLAGGTTRIGETLIAANPLQNESLAVEITAPCQYDPAGERLHA
jgi:sarcosine oxidase subunit alpha